MSIFEACPAHIDARPVENPLTHFVVVRRDLPLGTLAAMIVHAAGESSPGGLSEGTYAVVLAVDTEGDLKALLGRLQFRGVPCTPVYEPDPPWGGQLMAIGLAPALKSVARRYVSDVPLLKSLLSGSANEAAAQAETLVRRQGPAPSVPL